MTITMDKVINKGKKESLRTINLLLIFMFALLPLIILIINISKTDISGVFKDQNFSSAVKNSIIYSLSSALISTLLALTCAYLLNRANIKKKGFFVLLLTLPMLIPTISVGLGLRQFFGKNGMLDKLLYINIDSLGMHNLIIGSIIISFPICFLIIYDALQYENKGTYDAAHTLGISSRSSFFHVTLPYLKWPLVSAFFAATTLIFADYGIPMEVAGKINTLPMYLYNSYYELNGYSKLAFISVILLMPAVVSFIVDIFNRDNTIEESNQGLIKAKKAFNIIAIIIVLFVAFILFIPQLSFISVSIFKAFPNNLTVTLDNYKNIFKSYFGLSPAKGILNSILIAFLTGLFGTIFAYIIAYCSTRISGILGKVLHLFTISTIAIPGLVLGIGYIILFKNTKGFFYDTIIILVVVNTIHFIGTPYLMAKNCMAKINKSYESVGKTLGVSKTRILLHVILPNSYKSLLEMFSYFFLNSMITISAIVFLYTYRNQPLATMIITFNKSNNIEMQAVVSVIILSINILAKIIMALLHKLINRTKKEVGIMGLTRYQFNLLTFLDFKGKREYSQRFLSDALTMSLGTINKLLNELLELNYIQMNNNNELSITEAGYKVLEPYRVKNAIILAAGFGSRLAPVTLDTPKPLVTVNGVRIIDTLLDALIAQGITSIYIVRGYKKQSFDVLLEKYPFIKFIDNNDFNIANNISSLMKAIDIIDQSYICEADLLVSNKRVIQKYEYKTNYLGAKVNETDDWCFLKTGKYITTYQQGGEDCYQAFGISYWDFEDSKKLKNDTVKLYNSKGGKEVFWEAVVFRVYKKNYQVEIRECHKSDIIEIDNFHELLALDNSYTNYPKRDEFDIK